MARDLITDLRHKIDARKRGLRENPAWVTRAIAAHYDTLEDKVKPEWLPKLLGTHAADRGKAIAGEMNEYGCGAYGCVYETLDPKVVLKVTTDSTEHEFAARVHPDLSERVTVDYYVTAQLPEQHKNAQVYLLWREEAKEVGALGKRRSPERDAIRIQHEKAQAAYDRLRHSLDASFELDDWYQFTFTTMASLPMLNYLAMGMCKVYKVNRVFFGDVHEGNLGKCARGDSLTLDWVITDPGHVAVIDA